MCMPCCFIISTAEVGVIERWGKYSRLVQPGLNVIFCPMEVMAGRLSFRVQQLDVRVETKTLDNVFITAVVSVQYQILKEKVYDGKLFHPFLRRFVFFGIILPSKPCFF
jgi:regulator of protease activity HflC (stomatin/prohibitin superfamily)